MSDATTVSVIVCTYSLERWSQLQQSLDGVRAQLVQPVETVLVVDHAPDLLELARARFPWAVVVANAGERGLSDGRNTGLQHVTGEIVAFLDDDAVPERDWLARLLAPYADPSVLAVGGRALARWEGTRPSWFPSEFDWVVGCTYTGSRLDAGPVRNLLGANMSFRTAILRSLTGFDATLGRVGTVPLGCEETEMCLRVQAAFPDGQIWYEPAAVVHHSVPAARGRWAYYRARCWAEGLSKARLSILAGSGAALASERRYSAVVLPRAVARDLRACVLQRDPRPGVRASAVVAGFGVTCAGYARGRLLEHRQKRSVHRSPPARQGAR